MLLPSLGIRQVPLAVWIVVGLLTLWGIVLGIAVARLRRQYDHRIDQVDTLKRWADEIGRDLDTIEDKQNEFMQALTTQDKELQDLKRASAAFTRPPVMPDVPATNPVARQAHGSTASRLVAGRHSAVRVPPYPYGSEVERI